MHLLSVAIGRDHLGSTFFKFNSESLRMTDDQLFFFPIIYFPDFVQLTLLQSGAHHIVWNY